MQSKIEIFQFALNECESRLSEMPEFQPLLSIKAQLIYLINLSEGKITDRSRLNEIVISAYAAREFETRDMAFADLLYKIEELVKEMKINSR